MAATLLPLIFFLFLFLPYSLDLIPCTSTAYAAATITVAWDKNAETDVIGYNFHYGTVSKNYQYTVDVTNNTSCSISGLAEGTTYYFAVTAYNDKDLESSYSEELAYTIPMPSPPLPPVDTDGDGILDDDEISIYGTDPDNVDTDGDGMNDGDELAFWGDNWSDDSDNDGLVNLIDPDSDNDGYNDGTSPPPESPSAFTATAASSSVINLGWIDNSDNETGFEIERSEDSGATFSPLATVGVDAVQYADSGSSPETEYCYRVRAINTVGSSDYSNTDCETTEALPPPPPPVDTEPVQPVGSWLSGLNHTVEPGVKRILVFTAHVKDNDGVPNLAGVTYGGQAMTKIIEQSVGSRTRAYVVAYILEEAGIVAASNGAMVPTWTETPDKVAYSSVFFANADQITPIRISDRNSTTSLSTLATKSLATANGDLVFAAGTCGNSGSYSVNNDFIEGIELRMSASDAVAGYKQATGAKEMPKHHPLQIESSGYSWICGSEQ